MLLVGTSGTENPIAETWLCSYSTIPTASACPLAQKYVPKYILSYPMDKFDILAMSYRLVSFFKIISSVVDSFILAGISSFRVCSKLD
jgi:hypothetical protein